MPSLYNLKRELMDLQEDKDKQLAAATERLVNEYDKYVEDKITNRLKTIDEMKTTRGQLMSDIEKIKIQLEVLERVDPE